MSDRQEAIDWVARQLARGASFSEAIDDDSLPSPLGHLGHITAYVVGLYEDGTSAQWQRFVRAVRRRAAEFKTY